MATITDQSNPGLKAGDQVYDYRIEKVEPLKEISAIFYALKHRITGAQHIHISNGDAENTFSVAFKTVPKDSTGVAHILEHTVLCGSQQYPVRDPFFFDAEKKPEHLHERLYRFGLDHVSFLHPE